MWSVVVFCVWYVSGILYICEWVVVYVWHVSGILCMIWGGILCIWEVFVYMWVVFCVFLSGWYFVYMWVVFCIWYVNGGYFVYDMWVCYFVYDMWVIILHVFKKKDPVVSNWVSSNNYFKLIPSKCICDWRALCPA